MKETHLPLDIEKSPEEMLTTAQVRAYLEPYEKILDPHRYFLRYKNIEDLKNQYKYFDDAISRIESYLIKRVGEKRAEKIFLDTDKPLSLVSTKELINRKPESEEDVEGARTVLNRYKNYLRAIIQIFDEKGIQY